MEQIYTPLAKDRRQIRLLTVYPASEASVHDNQEPVRTGLDIVDLEKDHRRYEALSYAWSRTSRTSTIFVSDRPIKVTMDFEIALFKLRYTDRPRVLWIDAVCIDQENLEERGHQVKLMRDVYSKADRVIVWVGTDIFETSMAIMVRGINIPKDAHWPAVKFKYSVRNEAGEVEEQAISSMRVVDQFFMHPWWTRVWTLQEAVLAKELVFSAAGMEYTLVDLRSFVERFDYHLKRQCCEIGNDITVTVNDIVIRFQEFMVLCDLRDNIRKDCAPSFISLLSTVRHREATDARDKIFGLLGLTSHFDSVVDYQKSVAECYENFTIQHIKEEANLDILSLVLGPSPITATSNTPKLPSWVPDWSAMYGKQWHNMIQTNLNAYNRFNAAGNTVPQISYGELGTLTIKGHRIDEIEHVSDVPKIRIDHYRAWRMLAGVDQDPEQTYADGKCSISDAFWRTLLMESITDDHMPLKEIKPPNAVQANFGLWWLAHVLKDMDTHESRQELIKLQKPLIEYGFELLDRIIWYRTQERNFFITRKGFFGLGPKSVCAGDKVTVLTGGKMLYILRDSNVMTNIDSGGEEVQPGASNASGRTVSCFLGDAFVYGLMDGEALSGASGSVLEEIVLGATPYPALPDTSSQNYPDLLSGFMVVSEKKHTKECKPIVSIRGAICDCPSEFNIRLNPERLDHRVSRPALGIDSGLNRHISIEHP